METRNTIQKQTILRAVRELANHPTAEQVYEAVRPVLPTISRATVYRNLAAMAERGALRRVSVPDAADRFDHTLEMHDHIRCTECGAVEDIVLKTGLEGLDAEAQQSTGFLLQGHQLIFYGKCPVCAAKTAQG